MIKSMTGFASATRESEHLTTAVTIKSVNHRFLDVQLRIPQALASAEAALRGLIQRLAARGRLEVTIHLQNRQVTLATVELDEGFARSLGGVIGRARELGLVEGPMRPSDLLRFPQAVTVREAPPAMSDEDAAAQHKQVEETLVAALQDLDTMRRREGQFLKEDLERRRLGLAVAIERIASDATEGGKDLEGRLRARVEELGGATLVEPAALAQEVVRFVARSDISEEIVRFRAHLIHWAELADAPEPCGRKLDFLIQELNREINTIGSKAEGARVSEQIVEVKSELERMREQVQNVE